jgi:hypothetical protein
LTAESNFLAIDAAHLDRNSNRTPLAGAPRTLSFVDGHLEV